MFVLLIFVWIQGKKKYHKLVSFVSMGERRKKLSETCTDILGFLITILTITFWSIYFIIHCLIILGFLFRELLTDIIEAVLSTREHALETNLKIQLASSQPQGSLTFITSKDLLDFCRKFDWKSRPCALTSKYRRLFLS